ncbi:MAG: Hpt domain-containing protein [Deltaproteobacteria bacterium]|nr:Hpt domain-containing protein [Deltaproteobacteria bacterium]
MTVTVDRESIYENFMNDEELITESIDIFMESSAARLEALRAAVKERDADKVMAEAHALKGVVGLFSPGDIFESAKTLEFMGRNKDLTGVDEAFADFEGKLGELKALLQQWLEEGFETEEDDEE